MYIVYNICSYLRRVADEKDRMLVGKTIMLPDVRWGGFKGVTSRTFLNITFGTGLCITHRIMI